MKISFVGAKDITMSLISFFNFIGLFDRDDTFQHSYNRIQCNPNYVDVANWNFMFLVKAFNE